MSTDDDLIHLFGRIAAKQNLQRIDDLTKRIEELSNLEGISLIKAMPIQFNPGSDQWEKVLYFSLILFGDRHTGLKFLSLSWNGKDFDVLCEYENGNGARALLSAARVVELWRKARPLPDVQTISSIPPPKDDGKKPSQR